MDSFIAVTSHVLPDPSTIVTNHGTENKIDVTEALVRKIWMKHIK